MEGGGGGRGRLGGAGLRLPEGAGLTAHHLSVEEDLWDKVLMNLDENLSELRAAHTGYTGEQAHTTSDTLVTLVSVIRPLTLGTLVKLVRPVTFVALVTLVSL